MAALEESIAAVKGKAPAEATKTAAKKPRSKAASEETLLARQSRDPEVAVATDRQVEVDGRELKLTNLDKVLYPKAGFTKGEVIDYYARRRRRCSRTSAAGR